MTIEAKIICDSVSPEGHRLTTMQLRYPKFIHGELMTHRVFSRNASSSRAIPTSKLIEEVRSDALRAAPVWWGKNQPGMQAAEELSDDSIPNADMLPAEQGGPGSERYNFVGTSSLRRCAQNTWACAALMAAEHAEELVRYGAHKQIVNRLLEPFSHINVVVTATEWDNFFGLRLHKDAQPEMRALAVAMWEARKASEPRLMKPGEWHLPFTNFVDGVQSEDWDQLNKFLWADCADKEANVPHRLETMVKVSVARCARVSYLSFDTGKRSTVEEDLKLYDRLMGAQPLHASPAEHQATPDQKIGAEGAGHLIELSHLVDDRNMIWEHGAEHANFVGWRQYRKMLPGESIAPLPKKYDGL